LTGTFYTSDSREDAPNANNDPLIPCPDAHDCAIPVARRVSGFSYAIRNIVGEARKVEAEGRKVRYLNIGDPITFGFKTPPHMIEAVERAMRDGHNGYQASVGIHPAREAVAEELTGRGMRCQPTAC